MKSARVRRAAITVVGVVSLALLATACPTPPPYGGPPTGNRSFSATSVTVNSSNDGWNLLCLCTKDEPKVVNVGFRVILGGGDGIAPHPPNATAQVIAGSNHWDGVFEQGLAAGESYAYAGSEKGTVNFNSVGLPDLLDIAQGAKIEIAGVWAWKLEDDGVLAANVIPVANAAASAIVSALNATVGVAQVPQDMNQLVSTIMGAVWNMGFFNLFTTAINGILANLNVLVDDVVGSAMYIGVGSSGTLGAIVDGVAPAFPAMAIPVVKVPPDIGGGAIFSLGTGTKTFTNNFTNDGVDGQHTTTYTFG